MAHSNLEIIYPDFRGRLERQAAAGQAPAVFMIKTNDPEEQEAIKTAWYARQPAHPNQLPGRLAHRQLPPDKDFIVASVTDTGEFVFRVRPDYTVVRCVVGSDGAFATAKRIREYDAQLDLG